MTHAAEHEEILQRILAQELSADAPEAGALLAGCPVCRTELARLNALSARLRGAAQQERAVLAEALGTADRADEELVRRVLAPNSATRARSRPRIVGWRRFGVLALAAGLLVLAGLAASRYLVRPPKEVEILLGGEIECSQPLGVEAYNSFSWIGKLPPGGSFELDVYALEGDHDGKRSFHVAELHATRWIPTEAEEKQLPAAIYWEVHSFDVDHKPYEWGWAKASRP